MKLKTGNAFDSVFSFGIIMATVAQTLFSQLFSIYMKSYDDHMWGPYIALGVAIQLLSVILYYRQQSLWKAEETVID